ncbi:hypothetical protein SAMN00790413_03557 [Deinococcus hopiensis KR-140]|uniref:Uncharacterized protein n=1 Tax=Deinococcus hopiensis KR-140 TaxID=695939 RepID=A0A1W1UXL3_9DEIO|nr:hypothetical protein SAMN00790413_03557 [Deinococcus hopiensis KR-140]
MTAWTLNPPVPGLKVLADRAMQWRFTPAHLWNGQPSRVWLPEPRTDDATPA